MLKVKNESIPSTSTVRVTRNSHERICNSVNPLDQTFEICNTAPKKASNKLNNTILTFAFSSVDKGINNYSENGDKGVKERSKSNRSSMFEI